ncbi:2-acylglycerol O-acyltransferase [Trichinella spiralis]|uniref:diacylglycerol O-acyltransferase n=1 Tax=Trichinella spiralis TaxID=6334 RepID=A0ABR3KGY8_TRISP
MAQSRRFLGETVAEFSKKILGWSTPLICGRGLFNYTFGLLPYRRPIHTVVGSPIHVEQCCKPSQEQIDDLHKVYISALQELYDNYRSKYCDCDLIIR